MLNYPSATLRVNPFPFGYAQGKPITNYPLPITHYLLPITHYLLPIPDFQASDRNYWGEAETVPPGTVKGIPRSSGTPLNSPFISST